MAIIKTGTLTVASSGVAQNLNLGFVPSIFRMNNITVMNKAAAADVDGVAYVYWDSYLGSLATPATLIDTYTNGAPVRTALTTTGISLYQTDDSNLYVPAQAPYTTTAGNRAYIGESTNLVITGISQAANASVTATHSFTTADIGVTVVSFHGVRGMTQINGLRGVIQSVTSTTSFTVNIDSSNFGTYSAGTAGLTGGFANVITGAPVNTLYGNVSLPTAQANLGYIGLTLGTGIMVTANDVWSYEAILMSPATGP